MTEILARIAIVVTIFAFCLSTGCATSYNRCTFKSGQFEVTGESQSRVVGKGVTESLVENDFCGDLLYETAETGLSDNAVKAIREAVKGAVQGMKGGL
jgi:hypothetical protein